MYKTLTVPAGTIFVSNEVHAGLTPDLARWAVEEGYRLKELYSNLGEERTYVDPQGRTVVLLGPDGSQVMQISSLSEKDWLEVRMVLMTRPAPGFTARRYEWDEFKKRGLKVG